MTYSKITISGKICAGKTTLYQALRQKLGWPVFSTGQFFRDYAREHKLSLEGAEEQSEAITKKVDYKVRDLLRSKDRLIVEGWLAGIMANDYPGILKVFLTAADEERAKRFAEREEVDRAVAVENLRERERNWLAEIKKIYGRSDIYDPKHYDLVIDTTGLSPAEVLDKVMSALII